MIPLESPFLAVPVGDWLCSNEFAFAIFDGFPVSPGHVLVTTRRIVETWFDATDEEQAALMGLVKEAKQLLDLRLSPKPDGYNVGFNSGATSGQTVPHVHIHVIPDKGVLCHKSFQVPVGGSSRRRKRGVVLSFQILPVKSLGISDLHGMC
jgi:diadenosine tetraphosphate (Ap4A) HIT family hydrolase